MKRWIPMKGQAAIEYLMTYGWAILALLIVTAVLLTSGILSPSYLISEECAFGNNLPCNFAIYNEAGSTHLVMDVFNGYPYTIRIKDVYIETTDGVQVFSGFDSNVEILSGANHVYEAELSGPDVPEGSVKRFVGNLTYVSCAHEIGPDCSDAEHVISGRVVGRIIPQ
jgi:hypothetical protein